MRGSVPVAIIPAVPMAGTSLQRPIGVGPALEKARRIRGLIARRGCARHEAPGRPAHRPRGRRLRGLAERRLRARRAAHLRPVPRACAPRRCWAPTAAMPRPGAATTAGRARAHRAGDRGHPHPRQPALPAARGGDGARAPAAVRPAVAATRRPAAGRAADDDLADRGRTATIDAVLVAQRPVEVTVTVDGAPETYAMEEGETLSFSAPERARARGGRRRRRAGHGRRARSRGAG